MDFCEKWYRELVDVSLVFYKYRDNVDCCFFHLEEKKKMHYLFFVDNAVGAGRSALEYMVKLDYSMESSSFVINLRSILPNGGKEKDVDLWNNP